MNERIKELIPKLGEPSTWGCERPVGPGFAGSRWSGWADHRNPNVGWGPNGCTTPLYDEAQLKKFAELIVRECMKESMDEIVDDAEIAQEKDPLIREYLNGNNQGIIDAVVRFRNHFGVEE